MAFRIELTTSSTTLPPKAYDSKDFLLYLTINVDPEPMTRRIANTVDDKINVNFQYCIKPMTNAVMKVATAVSVRAIFSDIPSWTKLVSDVIRVVISPAPSLSKKAIFCRRMAARYCSLILEVICSPE